MIDVVETARSLGFDLAGAIDADKVVTSADLAASCSPKACRRYGTCWTCPPGVGAYEDILPDITSRKLGVVVQTIRDDVDYYEDWDVLDETRTLHNERLDQLARALRAELENVAVFSTGGCGLCETCTYPDTPCVNPDERRNSLSAHGVAVGATCQNAGLDYSFQNGCVRFIGMVLYG